jgi:hypothetical protein
MIVPGPLLVNIFLAVWDHICSVEDEQSKLNPMMTGMQGGILGRIPPL